MKLKNIVFASLTLASLPILVIAKDNDLGLSKQFETCMDKSGGNTSGMVECLSAEAKKQDVRLNKAYKEVLAQLTPARAIQLKEAQRAWLKFHDANCAYYYDPDGGTMARVSANDCVMSSTATRAKELENFKQ